MPRRGAEPSGACGAPTALLFRAEYRLTCDLDYRRGVMTTAPNPASVRSMLSRR
jgi:hypothetical protein